MNLPAMKRFKLKAVLSIVLVILQAIIPLFSEVAIQNKQQLRADMNIINTQPSPAIINGTFSTSFDKERAYSLIQQQLMFGYRIPGTTANRNCVSWIVSEMFKLGAVDVYNFTVKETECQNIIARVNPGHDQIVVFAAHFDSRITADKDPDPLKRNDPVPGANDGASGVAVMLELAQKIYWSNIVWKYEFWFIFFDAEDQAVDSTYGGGISGWNWCEGSKWLANDMENNPSKYFSSGKNLNSINAFILFDMVGGTNLQFIYEAHSNQNLRKNVFEVGNELGYAHEFPLSGHGYSIEDDHVPFYQKGVPTIDLIIKFWDTSAGWAYHHTTSDSIDHISKQSLYITGHTILTFLNKFYDPNAEEEPVWGPNNIILNWLTNPINIAIICAIVGLIIFGRIVGKRIEKKQLARLMRFF